MFTGIIKGLGSIISVTNRDNLLVLAVDVGDLVEHPQIGGSVAINGVCLTIVKIEGTRLSFEVMQESLRLSTLGLLKAADQVCIETPLRMGDELGGHLVQGHVDGTAEILHKEVVGENTRMRFWVSEAIGRQVLHKGSVALDGISLTVCDPVAYPVQAKTSTFPQTYCFDVWLLPHTLQMTTLGHKKVGEMVNLEVDYLLKAVLSRTEPIK